ncbi:MAG: hypothetical protein HY434_02800 [Candidatus Liptonbacteria bacterium]|nr:hypothetical protein [Candidatus Liptonbacteria bacterium]
MGKDYDLLLSDDIALDIVAERRIAAEDVQWKFLAKAGVVGGGLTKLLRELGAIAPGKYEQKTIARLLGAGKNISFLSVVCPDYATREEKGTMRYTFDSLGEGVGVVAGRALEVHARLAKFFAEHEASARVSFTLAMADQEASEENCGRVGIDRDEFTRRLRKSQEALGDQAKSLGVTLETPLLSEIDPPRWETARREAKEMLGRVSPGLLESARRVRHLFYDRWAGRRLENSEAMAMLLTQVEEYIAVGRYLAEDGRVILGLDAPVMAPFVRHGASGTPVIYFERPEY